ncbi:hypothetical protein HYH03_000901 [Edaphochlamys debaryana]|uniref:Uncharacterized protein n=1 Tax=Edaphochlamys debaryana TaxID=47281 RepID=A0A835YH33_9CHLO|nr:hypothetical protein HYH03_000901 [Edaphochlamys debaryana]|eukprot:KAG2501083.1 hypothetical protein HYH03_000901 [Edaphochlamys debaryana]
MFSFFRPKDRWKWDVTNGLLTKKVLKAQRTALRSGSPDVKRKVLGHIAALAETSVELQGALCDAKVTSDVCTVFLTDPSAAVQEAAADALAALVHLHPGNAAAVASASAPPPRRGGLGSAGAATPPSPSSTPPSPRSLAPHTSALQPIPHALALVQNHGRHLDLATSAAELLAALAAVPPAAAAVTSLLLRPAAASSLLSVAQAASRAALSASTPAARTARLMELLHALMALLLVAGAAGGPAVCRELGRSQGLSALLELATAHRGQRDAPPAPAPAAGQGKAGKGEAKQAAAVGQAAAAAAAAADHAGVVRDALSLLSLIATQVPAQRLPLLEADGVRRLLSVLRDLTLPWSVRLQAVAALTAAAAAPTLAAELVAARGLEAAFALLEAAAGGKGAAGGGGASTPVKSGAGAGASRAAASPAAGAPPSPATAALAAAVAVSAAADEAEPTDDVVAEALLGLIDAAVGSREPAAAAEAGARLPALLAAFRHGMADFRGGGYRVAEGAAQVLFRLARQPSLPSLLPALSAPEAAGPLAALVERGRDYGAAADAKQAAVVHAAWCAAGVLCQVRGVLCQVRGVLCEVRGVLCQVIDAERRKPRIGAGASSSTAPAAAAAGSASSSQPFSAAALDRLQAVLRLLDATAPALLAAAGAVAPPPVTGGTPGRPPNDVLGPAGLALLSGERVASDLQDATSALLTQLLEAAQQPAAKQALVAAGAAAAVRPLLPWRAVQYPSKRLLHLLGELEPEYQPFVRYGCGPLLAALLAGQGVDPGPLLAKKVDAHILLSLEDEALRGSLGLDEVAVLKVARIRSAHALFCALDAADGRMDGCVAAGDVEAFLGDTAAMRPGAAADLRERLFRELQVLPGEPVCFLQFVSAFPWFDGELRAVLPPNAPLQLGAPGPGGAPDYSARSAKRQRLHGGGAGPGVGVGAGVGTPTRGGTPGRGGAPVIEVD